MASDLRRLRALRAKSTRCWKRRATRSLRAARACSAAATRTPPRQRVMPRPAARSERLRLRGRRSGSRASSSRGSFIATPERDEFFFCGGSSAFFNVAVAFFFARCMPSSPRRCARPRAQLLGGWARWVLHACEARRMRVTVCVARGGLSSGSCCGCGVSRMSGVARRRVPILPVCVCMPLLHLSSAGRP